MSLAPGPRAGANEPAAASTVQASVRTWVCYAIAGLLLIVSVAAHNPVPLFAAVPLLLAPVASMLLAPEGKAGVLLRWKESGEGSDIVIAGELLPPPTIDARDLEVTVTLAAGVEESQPFVFRATADRIELEAHWRARDPVLTELTVPKVLWRDALGLMRRQVPVDGQPLPIERCPLEANRLGTVHLHRTIVLPGETRSRRIGESGEFYGVRAMVPGDSPRRINWRATARSGEPFTNEFSLERTGDVLIFLDARPTELGPWMDARILGVARSAALGMADGFLHERARVGLAVFGEFLTAVKLGGGRRQRYRIRETLLKTDVAPIAGPSERAGFAARRYFPTGITTIVLSSLADEASRQVVLHLRRRGYRSIVLSPSSIPVTEAYRASLGEERRLALRLAELVRRHQIAQVWAEAPVVDWRDYWSLAGFSAFLKQGLATRRTA